MSIYEDLIQLHKDLIDFGSEIQSKSSTKFEKEQHIESNVHTVFHRVNAYGIILHRAIKTLCENGWTHTTPGLLRTIMECSVNCLAIINNAHPEYMAFKYLYHSWIEVLRDNKSQESLKAKSKIDVDKGLENIKNSANKELAKRYVEEGNIKTFWFKPEEQNISEIISCYGSNELKFVYGALSKPVHASHIGMFLFKDDPNDIDINPCENPKKTPFAIISSCRLILELLNIRDEYEDLGFDSEYNGFLKRILEFENKVKY